MSQEIQVDLTAAEKKLLLKYAEFVITNKETLTELKNSRKKWIVFYVFELEQVIGELCYRFNRCDDDELFYQLDSLIGHLENYARG